MYVVPFSMGPLGSDKSHIGVQCTDSAYVAVSMRIMTRMGSGALEALGEDGEFVPCLHSVGMPLSDGVEDVPWPCNADNKYIVHFPETREIWSYGSGYGGNALLGKKCLALRIASVMARDEGWMAEHMLILKLTSPDGRGQVHHGRLPQRVRQDQPRDADPDARGLDGRDDRRRHRLDEVRRGRPAVRDQPRGRLLRRRAGHERADQPATRWPRSRANTIFTNCALTDDGDIWWEGMTKEPPAHAIDWQGNDWTPDSEETAAHPNARFTTPAAQDPAIAPEWEDPAGVPIDAILFGGRRATDDPARPRGVRLGARRLPRRDDELGDHGRRGGQGRRSCASTPSRCCRSAATTWPTTSSTGWRSAAAATPRKLPRIFYVNWFRKDADGRFLWPGFGENSRVLEWVFRRCAARPTRTRRRSASSRPGRPLHRRPRRRRRGPRGGADRRPRRAARAAARRSRSTWRSFGDEPARRARRRSSRRSSSASET